MSTYREFLDAKLHLSGKFGFAPTYRPDWLFDFQVALLDWATWKGRGAVFADAGMGKTPIQLVWAQNVVERTNKRVIVGAPLAVSSQTGREAAKFGITDYHVSRDGRFPSSARIVITNYERLHLFSSSDFIGAVADESGILKNFDGATKAAITEFVRQMPYRLLCSATPAPNDYIELGNSSEALGELGYTDMLTRFFKNDEASIQPMAFSAKWRFKAHGEREFWRWLCSWARALRKPSDLGFDDGPFILPPLETRIEEIEVSRPLDGLLFARPATTLHEQRAERRATITARCEAVARHALAAAPRPFVAWCHLNPEGDLLERLIPGSRQVSGSDSEAVKEERFDAFQTGRLRVLITKPKIGGFGMNWQHCSDMSTFPSHSWESYYQSVRRCWRFGQTRPVTVHVVTTEGEGDVLRNLQRKSEAMDRMFSEIVRYMSDALAINRLTELAERPTLPAWLDARVGVGA